MGTESSTRGARRGVPLWAILLAILAGQAAIVLLAGRAIAERDADDAHGAEPPDTR